jgi:hypothetical protein
LSKRRKKSPKFNRRYYELLQNKDWASFSSIGKTTNLWKLSITLNTQNTSAMLVLRCYRHMVFQKTLPATRSVIGTRKHLKRRLKRRST